MDPALVDRRSTLVSLPSDRDLPERRMWIGGLEGPLTAKILSKDLEGPATRLVRIPEGWGTSFSGAFTADVELFVIRGTVTVSGVTLERYDYVMLPAGRLWAGMRAETATLALLMISAPVRYDTAAGGLVDRPEIHHPADSSWTGTADGRLVRQVTGEGHRPVVWLSAAKQWHAPVGWHEHQADHEWFVLEGEMAVTELIEGQPRVVRYRPGGYAYRPAGTRHAGPGTSADDVAVAVCRSQVPLETTTFDASTHDPAPQ